VSIPWGACALGRSPRPLLLGRLTAAVPRSLARNRRIVAQSLGLVAHWCSGSCSVTPRDLSSSYPAVREMVCMIERSSLRPVHQWGRVTELPWRRASLYSVAIHIPPPGNWTVRSAIPAYPSMSTFGTNQRCSRRSSVTVEKPIPCWRSGHLPLQPSL